MTKKGAAPRKNPDGWNNLIYQLRAGENRSADDVVTELTHVAWRCLEDSSGLRRPDIHEWPNLYGKFIRAFKNRLALHEDCGSVPDCRYSLGAEDASFSDGPARGTLYLFTLRGGLMRFLEGIADLAWRTFRVHGEVSKAKRQAFKERVQGPLRRSLSPYLFFNEYCVNCRVRSGPAERRLWRSDPHLWRPEGRDVDLLEEKRHGKI